MINSWQIVWGKVVIVVFGAGLKLHGLNLWISNNNNNNNNNNFITVFPLKGGSSFIKIYVNIKK